VAGMEIRVGREPLIIALGRPVESTALPETSAAKTSTPSSVQPVPVASVPAPRGAGTPDACLLQARELVAASEARQEAVVRASLADLEQRLLAQRQYDMARVSAGLSYLEGKTGQSMARQTELMGQILRVSEGGAR
jgi:hypothetical protein